MARFLGEFHVKSDLGIYEDSGEIRFVGPNGSTEITLRELADDAGGETLLATVILEADSIEQAADKTYDELSIFLRTMSFVTATSLRISKRIRVLDWTVGVIQRELWVYGPTDRGWRHDALVQKLIPTAEHVLAGSATAAHRTAIRWFAAGMRSEFWEDQFQFFWFVVEIVATSKRLPEKVADRCPRCSSNLYCPTCEEVPTHRPYEKQKIAAELKKIGVSDPMQVDFFYIRNALLHGAPREEIEAAIQNREPDFTFDKAINAVGRIARVMLLNALITPGEHQLFLLEPDDLASRNVTPRFHLRVGPIGLNLADIPMPTITAFFEPRKAEQAGANSSGTKEV